MPSKDRVSGRAINALVSRTRLVAIATLAIAVFVAACKGGGSSGY